MKQNKLVRLSVFLTLAAMSASAAPISRLWDVDVAAAPQTAQFSVYRGETVEFSARLRNGAWPFELPESATASLHVSTNGVDYWSWPASATTGGVLRATWLPSYDCGAGTYRCFIRAADGGSNVIYRANFLLRLLGSPGEWPAGLPPPVRLIDFGEVAATNAPWLLSESDPTVVVTNGVPYVRGVAVQTNGVYLTRHQDISGKANTADVPDFVSNTVTKAYVEALGISGGGTAEETDPLFAAWLATNAPSAAPSAEPVGIYAYPGDWQLAVTDAGSTNGTGTTTAAKNDYLSLIAGTTGLYRRYRVEAVPEQAIIPSGSTLQPVDFSVYDPQGCVADFTDGIIGASGTPGLAMVTGTDTTGVSRTASVAMTPVAQGSTITEMYAESALAERYIWNTNILAKIAAVSTAAADMVDYRWCRHQDNWTQGAPADGHRLIPRALSRWGSDGRLNDAEWTWGGSGANKARFSPNVANSDFFWPELLPGLQCFSARAHETTASDNPSQCYPYIAVAPHYIVTAGHYSSAWWVGMRWVVQPYFCTDLAARTFLTAGCDRLVGKIPRGDGVVADMMLIHTSTTIPSNCLARFATDATLEQLSKSKFGKCVALTVTAHQTIAPLCLNATQSGSVYSWTGEPIVSTNREPYLVNAGDTAKAMALEHPVHMFDSGDPIFLASPSGKVVPVSIFCTSNGRSGSGPRFGDLLDSLSSLIRADSGGTEDIQYWSKADLWSGVGVNDLE